MNGTLGAPVREVSIDDNVHDAPCVIGLVTLERAANGLTDTGLRAIAAHDVLSAYVARVAVDILEVHRHGVFALPYLKGDEVPAVIWGDSAGCSACVAGEVVQHASLVHNEVGELGDSVFVVNRACTANNLGAVLRIGVPEGHLGDFIGLFRDFLGKAEGLEGFYGAGLDAVGLAQLEAVRTALNDARVDVGEHC